MKGRAVILDRDGVIIENRADYVKSWADVRFLPGALDALRALAATDFAVVIAANQSAVGRGLVSLDEAWAIQEHVTAAIREHGGRVDASFICPHRPEDRCACRKPAPGLLLQAARALGLDLSQSYVVGDAITDLQAAWGVGAAAVLVLSGLTADPPVDAGGLGPFITVADLGAAVARIVTAGQVEA